MNIIHNPDANVNSPCPSLSYLMPKMRRANGESDARKGPSGLVIFPYGNQTSDRA